jgi:NAD(P)-dependent dehydrogenase (short-subunit alcohol dehydrogenase family)
MAKIQVFKGKWALVTGSSAGIGAALAQELAAQGAKLILTARRLDRLEALRAELAAQGAEVRVVAADLNDPAAPELLYNVTEGAGLKVEILVNNAGLGQYGAFNQSPVEQELSQVRVNCEAVVRLTRLFLPRMVERRSGWVLVVASTASFQPVPYLTHLRGHQGLRPLLRAGAGRRGGPLRRPCDGALPRADRERVLQHRPRRSHPGPHGAADRGCGAAGGRGPGARPAAR